MIALDTRGATVRAPLGYTVRLFQAYGVDQMDAQVSELARHSANFGFLAGHEPLLAIDGAAAESYVYSDPDAAMVKARRFAETLARELLVRTRTSPAGDTQHDRVEALARAGVLVPDIREAFDRVRRTGNRAAHSWFGDVRAALNAVRTCFELGVWFHRALTGSPTVRPFIPPPDPTADITRLSGEDQLQLDALRDDLDRHRVRLTEALTRSVHSGSQLQKGSSDAGELLARAEADREQLCRVVAHLGNRLAEVEATFNEKVAVPPPVSASERDAFVDSAREAARWLTEIACTAVVRALDWRMRLEVATWTGPEGDTLTVTYTREGYRLTGTPGPGWAITDHPCPDEESLMTTLADLERKGYRPADDEGTRVIRARLAVPGALSFLSAAEVTAPPVCPPWCVTDHSGYVDSFHECRGPGLEMRSLDGQLIGAEPVRLTDACTGKVHETVVRVGDNDLDPTAARQYADAILAAVALIDQQHSHTS